MKKIYFKEEQKFGSLWLYLIMGFIYSTTLVSLFYKNLMQFVYHQPFGDKPISDTGLVVTTVLVVLVVVVSAYLLFGSRLETEINSEGIFYRFWPYFKKQKHIPRESIKEQFVRKYKPIREYGGWGVRKGTKKTGNAINVHGKIGLQLVLNDGKRLLLGTQRPDSVKRAMGKLMNGL